MLHSRYRLKQLTLAIGDVLACYIALIIALSLRQLSPVDIHEVLRVAPAFTLAFFGWIMINFINGLYDIGAQTKTWQFLRRLGEAGTMAFVVTVFFFYLNPSSITPKTILALTVLISYLLMWSWRSLTAGLLTSAKRLQTRVAFVGYMEEVQELVTICNNFPGRGYLPVLCIDPNLPLQKLLSKNIATSNDINNLPALIHEYHVDVVVIAPHLEQQKDMLQKLYTLLFSPATVTDLTSFYELVTGRIPPFTFSEGWFLRHLKYRQPTYEKLRSLVDIMVGILLLFLMAVLFVPVAVLIKTTSKGPVFISQRRVGKDGKIFTLYKFRSMYALAPDGSAEVNGVLLAQQGDKRITPIGNILRKLRIDELPQCINLLKRDITLIGPRPERPEIVAELEQQMPYYRLRHVVLPGLTGWAVLHQHYADTLEKNLQKLQYDLYYIKNRSLLLDLSIVLKTVNVIVRMLGQ